MNTMQQEFDAVVQHLYKQGRPAKAKGEDRCVYRTEEGLSCAVGCRIPDEMYNPKMDNRKGATTLSALIDLYEFPEQVVEYRDLFNTLQYLHDGWKAIPGEGEYSFGNLVQNLQACARRFGLTYNDPRSAQ